MYPVKGITPKVASFTQPQIYFHLPGFIVISSIHPSIHPHEKTDSVLTNQWVLLYPFFGWFHPTTNSPRCYYTQVEFAEELCHVTQLQPPATHRHPKSTDDGARKNGLS